MGDSGFGDDDPLMPAYQPPRSSIFERPGFGGLAFRFVSFFNYYQNEIYWNIYFSFWRNSIAALADKTSVPDAEQLAADDPNNSVDSASTLNRQMRKGQTLSQWDRDELESGK